jgi:hypothetical protein
MRCTELLMGSIPVNPRNAPGTAAWIEFLRKTPSLKFKKGTIEQQRGKIKAKTGAECYSSFSILKKQCEDV